MARKTLLDVGDDALVLILLSTPPGDRFANTLFVALACKRLCAAARAAVAALEEEARRGVLGSLGWTRPRARPQPQPQPQPQPPLPFFERGIHPKRLGTPCPAVRVRGGSIVARPTLITSIAGIMVSPTRFAWAKRLASTERMFESPIPTRARATFLSLIADHRQMATFDSIAAYRMSTRALRAFVERAPIHMIRASFYEVFANSRIAWLDVSLRHHRCLVLFAATHGRVDVLNWLVHRHPLENGVDVPFDPERDCRMSAHDRHGGLLTLFTRRAVGLILGEAQAQTIACTEFGELSVLLIRPAVLNHQHGVLTWLKRTTAVLSLRYGVMRHTIHVECGALQLTISSSLSFSNTRRTFGSLITDACSVGNARVLHRVATTTEMSFRTARCDGNDDAAYWAAGFMWSFLVLVINSRAGVGATIRWLIDYMADRAALLREMAAFSCALDLPLPDGAFVLEDLMAVLDAHDIANPSVPSAVIMVRIVHSN